MSTSAVVLIASPEVVAGLKAEAALLPGILLFADADIARAFETILRDRPRLVVLPRDLLATARAEELIGRIRTDPDPAVSQLQIRVTSDVRNYVELVSRRKQAGLDAALAIAGDPLPAAYERQRWARRFQAHTDVTVYVDGTTARLADLSRTGAQVVVPLQLRPNQEVRLLITDGTHVLRLGAMVVRAALEPSRNSDAPLQCRAGMTFISADREALDEFCTHTEETDRNEPQEQPLVLLSA